MRKCQIDGMTVQGQDTESQIVQVKTLSQATVKKAFCVMSPGQSDWQSISSKSSTAKSHLVASVGSARARRGCEQQAGGRIASTCGSGSYRCDSGFPPCCPLR